MNGERNRAPLILMEQLVMVLVVAFAALLCARAFLLADRTATRVEAQGQALLEAQNVAEILKGVRGNFTAAAEQYGGVWDGSTWAIWYDAGWTPVETDGAYLLRMVPGKSGQHYLGAALVLVESVADGQELCSLPVVWQEGISDA